jgi:hypothetical protein
LRGVPLDYQKKAGALAGQQTLDYWKGGAMAYKLVNVYAEVVDSGKGRQAVRIRQGDRLWWIPKSQLHKFERLTGREYRIVIPLWLAEQKQIERYSS